IGASIAVLAGPNLVLVSYAVVYIALGLAEALVLKRREGGMSLATALSVGLRRRRRGDRDD
ncbi:MAG: hypothetical protein RL199_1623, partial [Pseudomonadota bacterium]